MASLPKSRWIKCVAGQGNLRGVAIQAGGLLNEIAELHGAKGQAATGLGEAVLSALLVASYCKAGERVNLNIRGTGHWRQALVDATHDGKVRGYVVSRDTPTEGAEGTKSNSGPWGEGLMSILRTREGNKQPYIGTVPLVTGHLAKDLTYYWVQSEQVPSAVGLAVNFKSKKIQSATAFLVQALPGASPFEVREIEAQIQNMQEDLTREADPMKLLTRIFQNSTFMLVEDRELEFRCTCSWERVERALALVGTEELTSMISEDHGAQVRCDFCGKEYRADEQRLKRLMPSSV